MPKTGCLKSSRNGSFPGCSQVYRTPNWLFSKSWMILRNHKNGGRNARRFQPDTAGKTIKPEGVIELTLIMIVIVVLIGIFAIAMWDRLT
jgi:hypothetical protein